MTAAELAARKTDLIGSYQVEPCDDGGAWLTRCSSRCCAAIPSPGSMTIRVRFDALTLDEVNRAIKKHIDPSKLVLVKAGTV